MPFLRPTLSELIARARADYDARLEGADSRLSRSVLDVMARVHPGATSGLYGFLDFISRQILPDTAEAEYLARHAANWGLNRKGATSASGTVTVAVADGVIAIPAGAWLVRTDGARFASTADATIVANVATLAIAAEASGPDSNCDAGTTLTFESPIAGVGAVATVEAPGIGGGNVEERDEDLLARLLQRIRNPAQGGARSDYERWTLEVAGVTRAWVYPLYLGVGTVGVAFVIDGREDILPEPADVALVQDHLDTVRPVTAEVTVFAPSPAPIDFLIRLAPDTLATRAAVSAELADLFTRDAEPGGTMWRSRMVEAISLAAGETHHELLLPSQDFIAGAGFMPALGDVEFES
jgi:uncharacterized phage protein gp47/JayE